ncbi:MAG: galactonate dehydratase [Candidatus Poribacteria bacterium]|nr:galactonate dehydratase [Candidatus Poribacteria bacterium]MEC7867035.1 galactonate dehydratase [Candidatus Poribacteria bacterium]MEC8839956.1 galactonate dehydratase [Candidatus Poribacteria bacterium]|tara:strand:- start:486 stop:1631 length:1146 start_codon:yes stop_codon:yes gene_type:complete
MKITGIEQFFPRPRIRLVKITTDNGLVGWGETTLEGKPKSTVAAVEELSDYLIGKDPLRIEHHWQHIYRSAFFRGGNVLMTALSGIDQALWDIAGKYYEVPVYQLLGGPVRDRIRVYAHWGISSLTDEGKSSAKDRLEWLQKTGGYTAFKSGPGGKWRAHEAPSVIDGFVERAYLMREWVGLDVELAFDFHGKMTPALAIEICHELQGMRPMFVEEPVPQENVEALKLVSDHVTFPIATGERLLTRWGFREIFEKQAVAYIQPDISHVGGITELKKVANMGEVYYIHIMPHCAIGPVAFSASLHVDAAVPNFLIQEQVDSGLGAGLFKENWRVTDGHIDLPTKPGLGFEIDETEAEQDCGIYQEELGGEFYYDSDGSVADW